MAKIQRPIADGHATVNYCANSLLLCLTPQVQAIFEENVDGSVTLYKSGIKCKASFFFSFSFFFFGGGGSDNGMKSYPVQIIKSGLGSISLMANTVELISLHGESHK